MEKNVEMIEAGQVASLIVKDASRLGREYLQVGYYMEILFTHAFVVLLYSFRSPAMLRRLPPGHFFWPMHPSAVPQASQKTGNCSYHSV